jgi:hypothetical protein
MSARSLRITLTVLTVAGLGIAVYEWCATSAAILTVMAPLSIWRFLREEPTLPTRGASHSLEGPPAGSVDRALGTLPYR